MQSEDLARAFSLTASFVATMTLLPLSPGLAQANGFSEASLEIVDQKSKPNKDKREREACIIKRYAPCATRK